MLDALALGGQELDQLGAAVCWEGPKTSTRSGPNPDVGHVLHSFVSPAPRGLRMPRVGDGPTVRVGVPRPLPLPLLGRHDVRLRHL